MKPQLKMTLALLIIITYIMVVTISF